MNEDRKRRALRNNKLFTTVTISVLCLNIGNVITVQTASGSALNN